MAVEYRPEDTKEEVIGGTLIADDKVSLRHDPRQPSKSARMYVCMVQRMYVDLL